MARGFLGGWEKKEKGENDARKNSAIRGVTAVYDLGKRGAKKGFQR